jgi:hypothetical protein
MIVVLDFDRVVFDTQKFIEDLTKHDLATMPRDQTLIDAISQNGIDWKSYVDPDVLHYLQTTQDEVYILSSYVSKNRKDNDCDESYLEFFQSSKIRLSGIEKGLVAGVMVVGEDKTDRLEELHRKAQATGKDICFLDDEVSHVRVAENLGIKAVWYRTPANLSAGMGSEKMNANPEYPSLQVHNFKEFLTLKKNTEKQLV